MISSLEHEERLHSQLAAIAEVEFPIIIAGPPHSGKEHFAEYYFARAGLLTYIPIRISPQTTSAYLYGQISCTDTPGRFQFKIGVLGTSLQSGEAILIEMGKQDEKSCFSVLVGLLMALRGGENSVMVDGRLFEISPSFRLAVICDEDDSFLSSSFSKYLRTFRTIPFDEAKLSLVLKANMPDDVQMEPSFLIELGVSIGISVHDLVKIARRMRNREFSRFFQANNEVRLLDYHTKIELGEEIFSCFAAEFERQEETDILQRIGDFFELQHNILQEKIFGQEINIAIDPVSSTIDVGRFVCKRFSSNEFTLSQLDNFAATHFTKRLIQEIIGCVINRENMLLISSTGVGKTYTLQVASKILGNRLDVINFSGETDVTDLLGGYKPVSQENLAKDMYNAVIELIHMVLDTENSNNQEFVRKVHNAYSSEKYEQFGRLAVQFVRLTQREKLESLSERGHVLIRQIYQDEREITRFKDCQYFFRYQEGILVKALKDGHFVLLDEINLAPVEVLECIYEVLQNDRLAVSEAADIEVVPKHPNFRVFASMNPASSEGSAGRKELPEQLMKQFTRMRLYEMDQREDIQELVRSYLGAVIGDKIEDVVDCFFALKTLEKTQLATSAGRAPVFSVRTLCRALNFVKMHYSSVSLENALFEGFELYFASNLNSESRGLVIDTICRDLKVERLRLHQFRPTLANLPFLKQNALVNVVDQIYFPMGSQRAIEYDTSKALVDEQSDFVITPQNRLYIHELLKALLSHQSILLEGVTSAGKSSLVLFLARLLDYQVFRVNNHENTDISDYFGTFQPDSKTGQLEFSYGPLVRAMQCGGWLVLDELNLCNSEILEALNRLLDDNGEVYIAETDEIFRPEPGFAIFATQNPAGIVNGQIYGGRKQLSDAFKNRFVCFEISEISSQELEFIIYNRKQSANLPRSFAEALIQACNELRTRLSKVMADGSELQAQNITLRDVFRIADRLPSDLQQLALEIHMVLGERQRSLGMRSLVDSVITRFLGLQMNDEIAEEYYYEYCKGVRALIDVDPISKEQFGSIVFTRDFERIFTLTSRAVAFRETPLLIGDPGAGKTEAAQLVAMMMNESLVMLNLHKNTDVSDFIGEMRPVRGRALLDGQLRGLTQGNGELEIKLREILTAKASHIFQWYDGALLAAMMRGGILLLDEINLASDAILERLNSVFETERDITVPEKPMPGDISCNFVAHPLFSAIATMNPGNDHGKRELSPALRNRMTEIYVKGISDVDEVGLILNRRAPRPELVQHCQRAFRIIREAEVEFQARSLNFTIRDIIAVFDHCVFVFGEAEPTIAEFCNELNLCYLDGLQVRLCTEDEEWVEEIKRHIIHSLNLNADENDSAAISVRITSQSLVFSSAVQHYEIQVRENPTNGGNAEDERFYDFRAKTVAKNAFRLAKALASPIDKPILIESSPGTGKTSIVQMLASMTHHGFTRINLSENVDLEDLVGEDLPTENGGFQFVEGALLRALQTEDQWILFDELNLASQAVLEGLNGLFDHRKALFIPELNRTVNSARGVKLFAAENPAWQGNGRKQLPQSFLNRFLCLWFSDFVDEDYESVLSHLFIEHPKERHILFCVLKTLEDGINKEFGNNGGVWELNLRDIFRVFDFLDGQVTIQRLYRACCEVFMLRFRDTADLEHVYQSINAVFEENILVPYPLILKSESGLFLEEFKVFPYTGILVSHFPLLHAILSSFRAQTPILMVYSIDSLTADRIAAEVSGLLGKPLCCAPLSSSTDVSDIFGCYEQYSPRDALLELLRSASSDFCENLKLSEDDAEFAAELEQITLWAAEQAPESELANSVREIQTNFSLSAQKFVWKDGIVTRAVEEGLILYLENVNFCTSAVLDRLNSLLERDAEFYLYEQGSAVPRKLRIHDDFRVILAYESGRKDISRAVRNRCFEVCIDSIRDYTMLVHHSAEIAINFDNLRVSRFTGGDFDLQYGLLYNCFRKRNPLDCDAVAALDFITAVGGGAIVKDEVGDTGLLCAPDTHSHSRFFSGVCDPRRPESARFETLIRWMISYEYQCATGRKSIIPLGAFQISAGESLVNAFEAVSNTIMGSTPLGWALDHIAVKQNCPARLLLLADSRLKISQNALFYKQLEFAAEMLDESAFMAFIGRIVQDETYLLANRGILAHFQADPEGGCADGMKLFRKACEIDELEMTGERIAEIQRFFAAIELDFDKGRAMYKNESVLLTLCGRDELLRFEGKETYLVNLMNNAVLENIVYSNAANKSAFNLLSSPLTKIVLHTEQMQYSCLTWEKNQEKVVQEFNLIQHNTHSIIEDLPVRINAEQELIREISHANAIGIKACDNALSNTIESLRLLGELYELADFSSELDEAVLNQYDTEFLLSALEIAQESEELFAEHQAVTQARLFRQETKFKTLLLQLIQKLRHDYEDCAAKPAREHCDEHFYQELQEHMQGVNLRFLREANLEDENVLILAEQFAQQLRAFLTFLGDQKIETVIAYADYLLPVLFLITSAKTQFDVLRYYLERDAKSGDILLKLVFNAENSYMASRALLDSTSAELTLLLQHIITTGATLDSEDAIFIAAEFSDYDFASFERMLYEASPFRSKRYAREATFEEGLAAELRDMFPGYEIDGETIEIRKEVNQIPEEIGLIVQFGHIILEKLFLKYQLEEDGSYMAKISELLDTECVGVADELLLVLEAFKSRFEHNSKLYNKESTVLAELRSHTQRRRVICRNVYKHSYPSEVVAALKSLQQHFSEDLAKIATDLPDDARVTTITTKYSELLTCDLKTPLIFFMRGFEQLIDQINQFNQNSPYKFSLELIGKIKASIIYFRRIELASWSSFFDDIDNEQVSIALVSWPDLLIRAVGCCDDGSELTHFADSLEMYLRTSTIGQLRCKLEVLSAVQEILAYHPGNAIPNSIIQATRGRYCLFCKFVEEYAEEEAEILRKQFQDQIKLFQWEEEDFRDFEKRIRKSHCTILGIVRKYSELVELEVRTLRDQFISDFSGRRNFETADKEVQDALTLLSGIEESKDKRNFMEMQVKTALQTLINVFAQESPRDFDYNQGILMLAENAFVMRELGIEEVVSMEAISALETISQIVPHESIGKHQLATCREAVLKMVYTTIHGERRELLENIDRSGKNVGDRLVHNDREKRWGEYLLFIRTVLDIVGSVLERNPEFVDLETAVSTVKTSTQENSERISASFGRLIEIFSSKYGSPLFERIVQFEQMLRNAVSDVLYLSTDSFVVVPFEASLQEMEGSVDASKDLVLIVQEIARFLAKGYPESPTEQEIREKKELEGTGLGDEEGENDINSEVQEEELSEDQLLGNDTEEQRSQEISENDNGIEMDRDFAGEDQDVEEDEDEEEEEQDVERELNSENISDKEDQRQRSMDENSEELDEKSDEEALQGEDELAERDDEQYDEENDEKCNSDVSEQAIEYPNPDDAEEFEEEEDPSIISDSQQDNEELSENSSFDGVLEDIFREELEQQDAEEEEQEPEEEIMQDENPLDEIDELLEPLEEQPEQQLNPDQENKDENEEEEPEQKGFGAGNDEQSDQQNNDVGDDIEAERNGENGHSDDERSNKEQDKDTARLNKRKLVENDEDMPPEVSNGDGSNVSDIDDETIRVAPENMAEEAVIEDADASALAERESMAESEDNQNCNHDAEPEPVETAEQAESSSEDVELALEPSRETEVEARALSERLLMLLAPTETSELCGDFRSGKRLNLRKIVPFVASNYRRDKIWLRRERPEKRVYNLVICIDDSRSVSSDQLCQELINCVFVLTGAARAAELGDVTILSFAESVELLFGPNDASSATPGKIGSVLTKLSFKGNKTDFVALFRFLMEAENGWNAGNSGKTLILVLTDGMVGERNGLQEYLQRVQESAVVLFCIHNASICEKVQIVFENDQAGMRRPEKYKYLDKFPSNSYVVVREGFIAQDLGEAVAEYLAGMIK